MISSEQILTNFTDSYLQTAAWADIEAGEDNHGFNDTVIAEARQDCKEFIEFVEMYFPKEAEAILTYQGNDLGCLAGHDFYLTRNHHGAGFWDKDIYNELAEDGGKRLTAIAQSMGGAHVYVGDDGYLYFD